MAGLREEDTIGCGCERRNRLERCLTLPSFRQLVTEQAQLHLIRGTSEFGMQLEARAIEPLHQRSLPAAWVGLILRVADRVAEDRQAAVGLPVGHERTRDGVAGLSEELAPGGTRSWRSRQERKNHADAQGKQRDHGEGAWER